MFSSSARHCCIREPPPSAKVFNKSMVLGMPSYYTVNTLCLPQLNAGVLLGKYSAMELPIMRSVDWRKVSSHFHR